MHDTSRETLIPLADRIADAQARAKAQADTHPSDDERGPIERPRINTR